MTSLWRSRDLRSEVRDLRSEIWDLVLSHSHYCLSNGESLSGKCFGINMPDASGIIREFHHLYVFLDLISFALWDGHIKAFTSRILWSSSSLAWSWIPRSDGYLRYLDTIPFANKIGLSPRTFSSVTDSGWSRSLIESVYSGPDVAQGWGSALGVADLSLGTGRSQPDAEPCPHREDGG